MGSIGDSLRAARQARGLSLQQAEDETKIRKRYLEALEDEDYDVIPGRVYAKGFLRNYASFLGLNTEEMLMEFKLLGLPVKEDVPRVNIEASISKSRSNGRKDRRAYLLTVVIAVLAILTLAFYSFVYKKLPADDAAQNNKPSAAETTKPTEDNSQPASQPAANGQVPAQPNQGAAQPKQGVQPGGTGTAAPGSTATPGTGAGQTPAVGAAGQAAGAVKIDLKGKNQVCWLKVVVDGTVKFTGNIKPGEIQSYSGSKVEITMGNAGAVEVMQNGQLLGVLGAEGQVVKKLFGPVNSTATGTPTSTPTSNTVGQPTN